MAYNFTDDEIWSIDRAYFEDKLTMAELAVEWKVSVFTIGVILKRQLRYQYRCVREYRPTRGEHRRQEPEPVEVDPVLVSLRRKALRAGYLYDGHVITDEQARARRALIATAQENADPSPMVPEHLRSWAFQNLPSFKRPGRTQNAGYDLVINGIHSSKWPHDRTDQQSVYRH